MPCTIIVRQAPCRVQKRSRIVHGGAFGGEKSYTASTALCGIVHGRAFYERESYMAGKAMDRFVHGGAFHARESYTAMTACLELYTAGPPASKNRTRRTGPQPEDRPAARIVRGRACGRRTQPWGRRSHSMRCPKNGRGANAAFFVCEAKGVVLVPQRPRYWPYNVGEGDSSRAIANLPPIACPWRIACAGRSRVRGIVPAGRMDAGSGRLCG